MAKGFVSKTLREMAEKEGYTPGQFMVRRMVTLTKVMEEWQQHLDDGTVPPELGHMTEEEFRSFFAKEAQDLMQQERGVLEFFFPKLKASEDNVTHKGDINVTVKHFGG